MWRLSLISKASDWTVSTSLRIPCLCLPPPPQKVSLEFYIDVHAHSTMMNGFMYGNVFEDEDRVQRQAVFPRLLCQNAPDFSLVSNRHPSVSAPTRKRLP